MEKEPKKHVLIAGAILALAICLLMWGMAYKQDRMLKQQVYEHASALFDLILLTRQWNADHDGVFVEKMPGGAVNPFLKDSSIIDLEGKEYTKINPAMMTREISENAARQKGFSFHISSLKPNNPQNAPDPWEKEALSAFEAGETERAGIEEKDGVLRYRLMRPLCTEESCLYCHADQGYLVGDVRGGISVNLPYNPTDLAIRQNFIWMFALSVGLMFLFVLTLYFFIWRLLKRLSRQKAELVILNEAKDRFLGMAAHDLRNPLAGITLLSEVLREKVTEKQQLDMLDDISTASKMMFGLINDLLDVAKIRQGRLDLNLQEVDIAFLIGRATDHSIMLGRQKDIVIRREVPGDIGFARFDPERIRQVLDNLLSNAVKYSPTGTTVTIGVGRTGDRLLIWVQDQGIGIKQEELACLFDEFSKTSTRPTAGEESHGLGLAIVKKIVELHGGSVEVESEMGKGSKFTLSFPVSSG